MCNDLARALIAVVAVGFFAGEVRADDVEGQAAFKHVVECGNRSRQHDGLHLAAANRRQQVDAVRDRRATGDEAQRVLPDLVGRWTQYVAKALSLCRFDDLGAVRPARAERTVRYPELAVVVGAESCEPGDLGTLQVG